MRRSRTVESAAAGFSFDLSESVGMFASYRGEFGRATSGYIVSGGVRARF